jgi:two-component system, chemotaxis family, chemotaxis protein CheY
VKQILIVDDSQTVRQQIAAALEAAGFATTEAADGMVGLELARTQKFALIILDVNMPRMNGLEMLDNLRLDWATANVPVVILTTEAEEPMIERADQTGDAGSHREHGGGGHGAGEDLSGASSTSRTRRASTSGTSGFCTYSMPASKMP